MQTFDELSQFHVVRLNGQLFPVSRYETERYQSYQLQPDVVECAGTTAILEQAVDCDALLVVSETLNQDTIAGLQRCRVIARLGAGTDKIDVSEATRQGILVTNVPDFCVEEQADHTFALLLSLARKLTPMRTAMQAGQWADARSQCRSLHRLNGRTLGLIGFGGSGKLVAQRAAGFGMRILATRRRPDQQDPLLAKLGVDLVTLDALLRRADYVSLHLPLNEQTRHLLDAERLAAMQPGALLINTSRGALVDETAVLEALLDGHLGGYGVDTFDQIDLHHSATADPPNHPLLQLPNVVFTPHVAAFSEESSRDVAYGAIDNLATVLSGHWPPAARIVNPTVTPRQHLSHRVV